MPDSIRKRAVKAWRRLVESVTQFFAALGTFVVCGWDFVWGRGEPQPAKDSESGIGTAVSIVGIFFTQVVALYVSQRGEDYLKLDSPTTIVYFLGILLIFGMVSGMLRATKISKNGARCRTFDVGTRQFLYYFAVCLALIGAVVVPRYALLGQLLTQTQKVDLEPKEPKKYTFTFDKSNGVAFYVYIDATQFDGAIPRALNLRIDVEREFNRHWELTNVRAESSHRDHGELKWDDWDPERQPTIPEDPAYMNDQTSHVFVLLRDLDPSDPFRLRFALHGRMESTRNDADAAESAIQKLKTEKPIKITAIVPK